MQENGDDGAQNDRPINIRLVPPALSPVDLIYLSHSMTLQSKRYTFLLLPLSKPARFVLPVFESSSKIPMVFLKLTFRTLHLKYLDATPQVQPCALRLPMGLSEYSAVVLLARWLRCKARAGLLGELPFVPRQCLLLQ